MQVSESSGCCSNTCPPSAAPGGLKARNEFSGRSSTRLSGSIRGELIGSELLFSVPQLIQTTRRSKQYEHRLFFVVSQTLTREFSALFSAIERHSQSQSLFQRAGFGKYTSTALAFGSLQPTMR